MNSVSVVDLPSGATRVCVATSFITLKSALASSERPKEEIKCVYNHYYIKLTITNITNIHVLRI